MNEREEYDNEHSRRHAEHDQGPIEDLKDLVNPLEYIRHFCKSDIERKADRDADNDKYDPPKDNGGCFLTTACMRHKGLPDDCRELRVLREFRDGYLARTQRGRDLLYEYYSTAPYVVQKVSESPHADKLWTSAFDMITAAVDRIEAHDPENAIWVCKKLYETLDAC
jgi:hypothetical protein